MPMIFMHFARNTWLRRHLSRPGRHAGYSSLACAILAVGILFAFSDPALSAPRNILVIFSNSRLAPGNLEVDRGLRAGLAAAPQAHLFYEFLDSPEFGGEAHERTFIAYVRGKYASRPPEVLVTFSDAAFAFAVRNREAIFPGVPLVYGSVSPPALRRHAAGGEVAGVPVEYDFGGTIAQALRWHANAERLVIVTGASSRDREWEARLRRTVPPLAGGRRVEYWAGLDTETILKGLAELDARTVVFTPGYFIDGAGTLSTPGNSVERLARASAAPIYGPLDTFIGTGIVGGRMPSFEGVGRETGRIVAKILDGAPPSSLGTSATAPVDLHVDWRQVERFGIDPADIPADAVVHFRAPTFWEQYRLVAIFAASIILIQASLIAALLLERRRRRAAEVAAQKHRAELAHASRLAVAGELTASIAHEINQPLGAVQTSADAADLMLQSEAASRDDLRRIVARIRRDIVRASDVIRRLRTLLARHAPERRPFDVGAALADVATLMEAEARRRGVVLEVRPGTRDGIVVGDQTQIQQVLINLVLNAMDAVEGVAPERRVVVISTECSGDRIRVIVRDRGRGITTGEAAKVFDSFYSTKPEGMGLGLSIARTIVEAHDGRIFVEPAVDAGAAFCFELPMFDDAVAARSIAS